MCMSVTILAQVGALKALVQEFGPFCGSNLNLKNNSS